MKSGNWHKVFCNVFALNATFVNITYKLMIFCVRKRRLSASFHLLNKKRKRRGGVI